MTHRRLPILLIALTMGTMGLAGCIGTTSEELDEQAAGALSSRDAYDTARGWSMPLSPAQHDILPGVKQFIAGPEGEIELAIGLFLPDIEGCDWEAADLPEHCRLPVVIDAGPYFLDGVDQRTDRPPKVEWLVPRGYAVAQMSLRGTGESGGCFEFKNPQDVDDIAAVIEDLSTRAWSNGNVGMIGRSYDGTSAWAGAASGHPALKAIVPISGAMDGPHLYYKNGTTESRGPIQPVGYYPFYALGLAASDPSYRMPSWINNVCEGQVDDWTEGPVSAATGDASSAYWQSRDLTDDIVENYQGAVWVIHGLEDWNVNPSQAVPFLGELQAADIDTLGWLGQWGHAYPDRIDEHRNVRWDWADKVVGWFDFYLKGEGEQPRLGVEVEDSLYNWRYEESFPPKDATWRPFEFHGDTVSAETSTTWTSEPLNTSLRISGLPRLHLEAIPTTPTGGHLFAELYDVFPDGRTMRIGWGAINLLYADGGNTDPQPLVPMEPVIAKMQFEPMDAQVGEGHQLRLVIHKNGVEDIVESPDPSLVLIGQSTLDLPTIQRGAVVGGHGLAGSTGPSTHPVELSGLSSPG